MNRGFFIILAAQFFSSLGDNVLLFAAIALLKSMQAPAWEIPVLQQFFVFAFILLAPFVGPWSDALPKGRVMLVSNSIKMVGCVGMVFGVHPLLAYGLVGIGSSLYSPAKYGILVEYLPAERLVWANGWMEGLTVAAIISGAILGGILISPATVTSVEQFLHDLSFNAGVDTAPEFAILLIFCIYTVAAVVNLYIPHLPVEQTYINRPVSTLLKEFWTSFVALWQDPLGQVSLGVTSLFWGVGTTLRFIILIWAPIALKIDMAQATQLTAAVAIGLAIGSVIAAKMVALEHSVKVLPVGMAMGLVVVAMVWVSHWLVAVLMLILMGTLAGCFVIPMNALLQHRGHQLMGSGRSIAVQNCNENMSILLLLGWYALMIKADFSVNTIVVTFGLFIFLTMGWLTRKHHHDQD